MGGLLLCVFRRGDRLRPAARDALVGCGESPSSWAMRLASPARPSSNRRDPSPPCPHRLTRPFRRPRPASSPARDWPRDDRAARRAWHPRRAAARSNRARRAPSAGNKPAFAASVMTPPNRSVRHPASSGAARGSVKRLDRPAGIVGLLDAIDQRTAPQRHAPDVHAHVRMGVEALGRHRADRASPTSPLRHGRRMVA